MMSVASVVKCLVAFWLILLQVACQDLEKSKPDRDSFEVFHYDSPKMRRNVKVSRRSVKPRVAGGSSASKGRFPYMVSLRGPTNEHACGGALISKCWVVTAAHCVHPRTKNSVGLNAVVVIGGFDKDDDSSVAGVEMMRVAKTFIHEDFDPNDLFGQGSDIALLKLEEVSTKTPVGLPDRRSEFDLNDKLLIIGWGKQGVENPAKELQQAFLSFIPRDICGDSWGDAIHPSLMCASDPEADACTGDSGGPLLIPFAPKRDVSQGEAKFDTIVGLTSFGDSTGCGRSTVPGAYTKLSKFVDWIERIMDEGQDCVTPPSLPPASLESKPKPDKNVASRQADTSPPEADIDEGAPNVSPKEKGESRLKRDAKKQLQLDSDLLVAAKIDNRAGVKRLLRQGANVNFVMDGWSPLLVAAQEGLLELAMILLDAGADLELAPNGSWTPFIRASFDGHTKLVRFFAEKGANVDARTEEGNTALIHAAFRGRYQDVEVLLDVGANVGVINENGSTAKEVICRDPNVQCPLSTRRKIEELLS